MSNIKTSITQLIGHTPMIELTHLEKKYDLKAKLIAKVEYFNVTGSVKDRAALQMILDAEANGSLKKGSTIVEPTSGNTGIGLAAVGISKGYAVIIVMPETMSMERRKLMQAYGAKVVLSDGSKGMKGAIEKANEIASKLDHAWIAGQFENHSNWKAHYLTTGKEIYEDTDGKVDMFVAGVGTGGTITGVGKYLKEKNPNIEIVAVEPDASAVLSGENAHPHAIQGIGAGFIPAVLDTSIYDQIIRVTNQDAYKEGREVAQQEGLLVGISSGAALYAAIELAKKQENDGKTIVVLLPDSGDRYLSTDMFGDA